jgi:16S rRNA processing protein RimM
VDHGGEELLIPAAEELITEIDDEQQIIYMNLPVGLVDQTEAEIDQ